MTSFKISLIKSLFLCTILWACRPTSGEPKINVENAWGRPSPKVAAAGAFYLTIKNQGIQSDTLISADSPACGTTEIHESYQLEDGAMGMRPVNTEIEIPPKGQVELKMGGLHIMCIDKNTDFDSGSILPLELNFEISGSLIINVEIRDS